ncbi:MAG TPA: CPBP family intramembrane glutamic endopeptidase [Bacillales bacterium]
MRNRRSQAEMIRELPDRDLILNLYFTQFLLALAAFAVGWYLFDGWEAFFSLFQWRPISIFFYGGGLAAFVISLDFCLMYWLPEEKYDDGGINERIFSILSVPHILFVALLIAFVEEILFRGVLQANFGLIIASLIFAVLHVRYLRKIVLFVVTVVLSFMLGLLFWYTGNLFVTIFAHFMIDCVLGVMIRLKHEGAREISEPERKEAEGMEPVNEDNEFALEEAEEENDYSSLPPRSEYHRRKKGKKSKKKWKNPLLVARILLAAFIILVIAAIIYSISNKYFS